MNPVYRTIAAAVLVAAAALVVPAARAFNSGDIVVDGAKGDARLSQAGKEREARRGMVVLVPATLRTGRDGIVDLRQGTTLVNVGPETVLEFPAAQERGAPVERIVQSQGNAFYDIGKRDGRKLRVETPYLVAVIKGTQFSVSVQESATSISLVEGSLEILSPDGGATVDLSAGEIATRRQGDAGITVMDSVTAQVRGPGAGAADAAGTLAGERAVPAVGTNDVRDVAVDIRRTPAGTGATVDADLGRGVIETGAAVTVAAGVTTVDISAGIGVGQVAAVDVAVTVDAGPAGVAVEAGIGVDAGIVGADVGAGAGVDLAQGGVGASVDVDAGVAVGPVDAVVAADAGIDVGQSGASVDLGAGAAVDADPLGAGVDAGLSADLGGGAGSPGAVEVDAGVGVAGVDAGVSAGVYLGAGTVNVGVDLGIVDLDVGLDLGLDDPAEDTATEDAGTDTQGGGDIIENVGGLLDGLLRRPGRR